MANEEHLKILQQGVDAWNRWRGENPAVKPNLTDSRLRNTNFAHANFRGTNLIRGNFNNVYLSSADFAHADLSFANLLISDLTFADFSQAIVSKAVILYSNLYSAYLDGTDFCEAAIGWCVFPNVDLSNVKGLETVYHEAPSSIGVDTLALTLRGSGGTFTDEQLIFFEGAGVPPLYWSIYPVSWKLTPFSSMPASSATALGMKSLRNR